MRFGLRWVALLLVGITFVAGCRKKQDSSSATGDEFLRWSNVGKAHLDRGEAKPALEAFQKAHALNPTHPDARLNLANASLLADDPVRAGELARAVLAQEPAHPAALYVAGLSELRQRNFTNAVQLLQQAKDADIRVNAVSFQLGLAYEGLGRFEEALAQFEEIAQFDPDFPGVHFRLSQVYQRLGRPADAAKELQAHQQWLARHPNANLTPAALEKSKYTEARVPFQLEQPEPEGIKVVFTDVTTEALGNNSFAGPVGLIDFARDGTNHLLVRDGDSFRLLINNAGKFAPGPQAWPFTNGGTYTRWLVADLNKDAVPDALVLGDRGVHLYRFTTNGTATETTLFAGLRHFAAIDGLFADLNFRGDLDLVAIDTNRALRVMSNLQNMYFVDTSTNAPALTSVQQIATDDWTNDETQDLLVGANGAGTLLLKQRGGAWSNLSGFAGTAFAFGDLNNDLKADLVTVSSNAIHLFSSTATNLSLIALGGFSPRELKLMDFDNDGWVDVLALGDGLRVFRNLGAKGFRDVTSALGLHTVSERIQSCVAGDLDGDCDTDIAFNTQSGVRIWRNDGGNKNHQLRVALQGTRSNSSGIGVKVDVVAGGLRTGRRLRELPLEIGVGKHQVLDAVNAHWFELSPSYTDINLTNCAPLRILELALPTGSCPYLYTWDGQRFRFRADLLCSAPLGLPIAPGLFVDADEDEIVALGDERAFQPRVSTNRLGHLRTNYVLQITEELREVLYLDQAQLLVVDRAPGTEVQSTTKMVPSRKTPGFGRHELATLQNRFALRQATSDTGADITAALQDIDEVFASPARLREPQLRGLAEPHSITLDFGNLPTRRPLVLALNGWLRFGGGMANIAASSYSDFPFPFPTLHAEVNGRWQRVDLEVGAPSGRAKTILVELDGKLPSGTRRLRVTAAFEIHWDRAALFEAASEKPFVTRLAPSHTDLHRRGYSEMRPLDSAPDAPLVPDYQAVSETPLWRFNPSGWATRYGAVNELLAARDNALALVCAGDELTVEFSTAELPAQRPGTTREFFLFVSGWDKDGDFHVRTGTQIEPLPWHGMDDQNYGLTPRPTFTNDAWVQRFNTRWVGEHTWTRGVQPR
jgi:tetratricopeptide (TPR) repeat protein